MPLSPMESLYGAFGNPTSVDRQRLYSQQQDALRGSIGRAETTARADAARSAVSAGGGGNPYLAGRLGAQAGGQAAGQIQSQGIQQQAQLGAQQQAQEIAARQQQGQWAQHMLGGLIGAGGQVLGMAVPAFGALRGAAGATGMAQGLSGSGNPIGGMLGSALGGGSQYPNSPVMGPYAGGGSAPMSTSSGMGYLGGYDPATGIGSPPRASSGPPPGPSGTVMRFPNGSTGIYTGDPPPPGHEGDPAYAWQYRIAAGLSGGQAQPTTPAPPGMRWDPAVGQWVPVIGGAVGP